MPSFLSCPICKQKTHKIFEDLSKNRYILQYLDNVKSIPNKKVPNSLGKEWNAKKHFEMFFDEIDTDKNGFVSQAELADALKKSNPEMNLDLIKSVIEKQSKSDEVGLDFEKFYSILNQISENVSEFVYLSPIEISTK